MVSEGGAVCKEGITFCFFDFVNMLSFLIDLYHQLFCIQF